MTSIQRTGIAVLLALLAIFGIYKYGYNSGWGDRDAEMQAEIAKKNEEARAKEQEMAKAVADKETELRKANDVVAKKQTDLNRLIASGRVRLPSASCVQASPSAAIATRDSNQAPSQPDRAPDPDPSASGASESERQTLQLIAQIAADGDRAINQLNACIDAYENMRSIINGQQ
jgi:F0F1-type ATP synthase membrane subunit b/b'